MKKEMKKVPAVRFKGFTGDWEQRKLGDIAKFINGRAYAQNELLPSGKYKVLRVGNFYTNNSWYYSDLELDEKYYANDGDLLYTWSATFGPHIWRGDRVIYHYHIWKIDLTDKLEKRFAVQLLEQDKNDILSGHNGSTMAHITKERMEQKKVIIPKSIWEQRQLGLFFDNLDNLITLHQRKSDQLKKLKAYFLQNLFPDKGEKVPKIRFKGFTGDWEERKIGDCFDERKEGMPNGELLSVTINEGVKRFSELERHDSSNQDKSKYKKVCIGDIAYNSMRMWQGASGVSTYEGIVSPAYTILKPKNGINSKFVSYLFKKKDILYIFQVNSQGITSDNWNLKFPILSKISIRVPASIKEQNKIAKQMEKIDDIITLHQQKIAQFQAVKKFLLQNLFV